MNIGHKIFLVERLYSQNRTFNLIQASIDLECTKLDNFFQAFDSGCEIKIRLSGAKDDVRCVYSGELVKYLPVKVALDALLKDSLFNATEIGSNWRLGILHKILSDTPEKVLGFYSDEIGDWVVALQANQ